MKAYRYGMRLRPFSIGTQPNNNFMGCELETIKGYYNILVYNEMLSNKDLFDYDLDYLGTTNIEVRDDK